MESWLIVSTVASLALAGSAFHTVWKLKKEKEMLMMNTALCAGWTQYLLVKALESPLMDGQDLMEWMDTAQAEYSFFSQSIATAFLGGASIRSVNDLLKAGVPTQKNS